MIKIERARLAELVGAQPGATPKELRQRLGVRCAISVVCMALKKLGMSLKEGPSTRRNRTVQMSRRVVNSGVKSNPGSTRTGRSSSMKRGPRPT